MDFFSHTVYTAYISFRSFVCIDIQGKQKLTRILLLLLCPVSIKAICHFLDTHTWNFIFILRWRKKNGKSIFISIICSCVCISLFFFFNFTMEVWQNFQFTCTESIRCVCVCTDRYLNRFIVISTSVFLIRSRSICYIKHVSINKLIDLIESNHYWCLCVCERCIACAHKEYTNKYLSKKKLIVKYGSKHDMVVSVTFRHAGTLPVFFFFFFFFLLVLLMLHVQFFSKKCIFAHWFYSYIFSYANRRTQTPSHRYMCIYVCLPQLASQPASLLTFRLRSFKFYILSCCCCCCWCYGRWCGCCCFSSPQFYFDCVVPVTS